ncbi:uncharacterized protein LOC144923554 [Branchiostoma floridae x Branchiostoma belcheri]
MSTSMLWCPFVARVSIRRTLSVPQRSSSRQHRLASAEGGKTLPLKQDRGWAARGRLARGDQGPDGRKDWILSRTGRKTAAGLAAECARELWEFVGRNFGSPRGGVSAGRRGFRRRDHR